MGFMDFMRRAGSWIKDSAQRGFSFVKKGADAVKDIYRKATNIPMIGSVIRSGVEAIKKMPIPYTNVPIGAALSAADKVITTGDRILNR